MAGTLLGAQLTDENRIWQAILGATVSASGLEMASLIDPEHIAATFDEWLGQMVLLQQVAFQASAEQAAKYVRAYRAAEIGAVKAAQLPVVVPEFDFAAAIDAVAWAPWQAQAAIRQGTNPLWAWDAATRGYSSRLWREAMEGGRQVVSQSVKARGGRWRRVADGNPCAFCAMLVTRGPVYSETTVDFQSHAHCGCTVEEVFGEWQPTKQEQQWIDEYYSAHSPGMSVEETVARMRQSGTSLFNDAAKPKTQTGGTGGGSAPPNYPVSAPGRPEWWPEGEEYWAARQSSLRTPTYGDQLTRAEVLAMEKLEALGERAEWVPKTRMGKTSDFYWASRDGKPWDIKTPSLDGWAEMTAKQQYKRIAGRISDDAPFKKNAIVDLGDELLTDDLRRELAMYNARRAGVPDHQIRQMVVLSQGGLEEIVLI